MEISIHKERISHFTFLEKRKGPITSHENTLCHPHTCMFDLFLIFLHTTTKCSWLVFHSLAIRHLIRRWSAGNIKIFSMQKDTSFHTSVGEKLVAQREFRNQLDKLAVKLLNGQETVGHLSYKFSRIAWFSCSWWIDCCWSERLLVEWRFPSVWRSGALERQHQTG